jgi:hypothetical protein
MHSLVLVLRLLIWSSLTPVGATDAGARHVLASLSHPHHFCFFLCELINKNMVPMKSQVAMNFLFCILLYWIGFVSMHWLNHFAEFYYWVATARLYRIEVWFTEWDVRTYFLDYLNIAISFYEITISLMSLDSPQRCLGAKSECNTLTKVVDPFKTFLMSFCLYLVVGYNRIYNILKVAVHYQQFWTSVKLQF